MIRGTTPTLEFTLPFSADLLSAAYVTLSQSGEVIIDKSLDECRRDGTVMTVVLTQEETLKLDSKLRTEIQIRARTIAGEALASDIINVSTGRILKDGVI